MSPARLSAPLQITRPAIAFRRDEHYCTLGSGRDCDVIIHSSKVGAEVIAIACFREDTSIAVKSLEGKVFIDRSRLEGQRTVEKEIQIQIHHIKSISLQVLDALACLHSNPIIRRDQQTSWLANALGRSKSKSQTTAIALWPHRRTPALAHSHSLRRKSMTLPCVAAAMTVKWTYIHWH